MDDSTGDDARRDVGLDARRFGDVRSVLQEPRDARTWALLCHHLDQWPAEVFGARVGPYVSRHLASWPDSARVAPPGWLDEAREGAAQRMNLARVVDTEALDALLRALPHLNANTITALTLRATPLPPDALDALLDSPATGALQKLVLEDIPPEAIPALTGRLAATPGLRWLGVRRSAQTSAHGEEIAHALARAEGFAALEHLDLSCLGVRDRALRMLMHADITRGLRQLNLTYNHIGARGLEWLGESPQLGSLRALWLSQWHPIFEEFAAIDEQSLRALLHHPALRLDTFGMRWHSIQDSGWRVFAEAPALAELRALELEVADVSPDGLRAFIASGRLANLRALHLRLSFRPTGQHKHDALVALVRSPDLQHMHTLEVRLATSEMLQALATSPHTTALRALHLTHNDMTDADLRALAETPTLHNLEHLTIALRGPRSAGVCALLRSPHLRNLRALHIGNVGLDHEVFAQLASAPLLPRLRALSIHGSAPTVEACALLARTPALSQLRHLSLSLERGTPEAGVALLAASPHLVGSVRDALVRRAAGETPPDSRPTTF